jgi:signal-transduction protein with cAMP-binding, CBS, and nucleotidyltransferase domain
VVTSAGVVKGIISDRDLLACLAAAHDPYQCKVGAHMRRPVIVLKPEEDVATAAEVMRARRIKRLPIAKNGLLVGIVSLSDLAAVAGAEADKLRSALNFFTAVVRAQSSQSHPPREAETSQRAEPFDVADVNSRSELNVVGGPG